MQTAFTFVSMFSCASLHQSYSISRASKRLKCFPALGNMRLHRFASLTTRVTFFRPLNNAFPTLLLCTIHSDLLPVISFIPDYCMPFLLFTTELWLCLSSGFVFPFSKRGRSLALFTSPSDVCQSKAPYTQHRKDLKTEIHFENVSNVGFVSEENSVREMT